MMRAALPVSAPSDNGAEGLEPSHLGDLRRLRRRLLFGGGVLLSLVILTAVLFSAASHVRDYHEGEQRAFAEGLAAVDYFLFQRDRAYASSINANDVLWTGRRGTLEMIGRPMLGGFHAGGDAMMVVATTPSAVPWLVLGLPGRELPADELAAYLGMVEEYSAYTMATITWQEGDTGGGIYGYEPQGRLLAVAGMRDEAQLLRALGVATREEAFARLMGGEATTRESTPQRGPVLSASRGGRLQSAFGDNPFTGVPSLVGTITLADGNTPYFRRVVFEPVGNIRNRLAGRQQGAFLVSTGDLRTVFESGALSSSDMEGMKRWAASLPEGAPARASQGGWYLIGGRVKGADWRLVHAYRWQDIWAATRDVLIWHLLAALSILGLLWWILLRMDRRLFAPALADASRVYESQTLSRAIIDTSPVGLALISVETGHPLLQNELALELVGDAHDGVPEPYADLARRASAETGEGPFLLAWPAEGAPDGERQLEAGMARATFHDQQVWLCALRDVTAQAELQHRLQQAREDSDRAREMAEAASRAKTAFVAHMSHEIRTPLNGVLGHLELLGRSRLQASQRERLSRIRQSADSLMDIISDVLDFSKIEAGQLDVEPGPFQLRPLIEQAALLYAPGAARKGLKLYYQVLAPLGTTYIADAHRIRQILNNLLSNAVKFTEAGRVLVRASVRQETGGPLLLQVQVVDSGIGMSSGQLEQLFRPFQQADASIARRYGGSGLGLALCQQLAQALGGEITAESTQGVGSAFTLQIPLQPGQAVAQERPLQGRRITVLSASAEWREEVPRLLQEWGAQTLVIERPSAFGEESSGDALLVVGERRAWEADDESALLAAHARRVRAYPSGPLLPELREGDVHVSCYSSAALLGALISAPASTAEPARADEVAAEVEETPQAVGVQRGQILLVEDNPVNRELIQQQLEELGYLVDASENGQAALSIWREGVYVAVLTDINMPVMDGYTFARTLRARGATLPILAITATALASERSRCRDAGIDDLLLKPLDLRRLDEGLRRHVAVVEHSPPVPAVQPVAQDARRAKSAKLRRVFVQSGTDDLQQLRRARQQGDDETLLDRLHAFKGALAMMGERDLAQRCGVLEMQLRQDQPYDPAQLDTLLDALQALIDDYARLEVVPGETADGR